MRKSIVLVVITILITISFTPIITSAPIIRGYEDIESNSKSEVFPIDLRKENGLDIPRQKVINYFCFVVIKGDVYRWSMLLILIGLLLNEFDFWRLGRIYEKFFDYYDEIANKIPFKIIHGSQIIAGGGKSGGTILTIGLKGIQVGGVPRYLAWALIGFRGIWFQGDLGEIGSDFAIGFATCVVGY